MSDHVRAVVAHYDERATSYDEDALHRGLVAVVAGLPELDEASTLLDVATGTGLFLRALTARRPSLTALGIDRSPGMLEVAARKLPGARLALADAADLPLPDSAVDVVTAITVLHLFEDPATVVTEWARVLVPGGLAVTATFDPTDEQASPALRDGFVRRHSAYGSPDQVAGELGPHGFRLVRHTWWEHGGYRLLICLLRR
jgi:ubiquinone/menaquinone biosynthesis C-methylase UbiE